MPPKKAVAKKIAKSTTEKTPLKRKVKTTIRRRTRKVRTKIKRDDKWMWALWLVPVALIAIFAGVFIRATKTASHPVALTSAKLVSLFSEAESKRVGERIAFWSDSLLKDPYLLSPLGSGPQVNDDAPVFPRSFDCTTFVETVAALARSHDGRELADNVLAIRYRGGKPTYEARNHFPEADWIPNNESAGILRDVTTRIARKAGYVVSFANKDIDKLAWFKSQGTSNRVIASAVEDKLVTVKIPYLPIDRMAETIAHIAQGAVINVVRENKDRFPVLISHQGFLIWKDGEAYFRHASRNKRITEIPFKRYLESMRGMPWKVVGFNINAFEG